MSREKNIYIYIYIATHDMPHVTCDTWQVTCDTWHVTCDILWGWTFSLSFSSLDLTVCDLWYFDDLEEKADSLTDWINYLGVCRSTNIIFAGKLRYPFSNISKIGRQTKTTNKNLTNFREIQENIVLVTNTLILWLTHIQGTQEKDQPWTGLSNCILPELRQ